MQRDPRRYLQAVQKVIACMTLGIDVSKLFSEMIMVRPLNVSNLGILLHIEGPWGTCMVANSCHSPDLLRASDC